MTAHGVAPEADRLIDGGALRPRCESSKVLIVFEIAYAYSNVRTSNNAVVAEAERWEELLHG